MPSIPHIERHFTSTAVVRDLVIGMSDGLTVPFALAAGLSSAVSSSRLVVTAGLAEIAAGAIAMGLGGFLATRGDAEHYRSERDRELREVRDRPEVEAREIVDLLAEYGVTPAESEPLVRALRRDPQRWVDFMMRFELGLEQPAAGRALRSALTIGGAYILGGLVPLLPYTLVRSSNTALAWSVTTTLLALLVFGFLKGRLTGAGGVRSALQTTLIGGLAAAAAFAIARAIG
ncbi:MAG: VIT1/CCC1 transporter family protein [Polyangia bacterium]